MKKLFLLSPIFWISILLVAGIMMVLVFMSKAWLSEYTNHGQYIVLPDFKKKTLQNVQQELKELGVKAQIDSVKFEEKYKPFEIYQQEPKAGSKVKPGRTVVLIANPRTYAPITVPDMYERSIRLTRQYFDLLSLKIGKISYEPHIAKDVVLKMIYQGEVLEVGDKVPKFSLIDLVLGEGPRVNVEIPNMRGLTLQEVQILLDRYELSRGSIMVENVIDSTTARVFDQIPSAGTLTERWQDVNLYITNDEVIGTFEEPLGTLEQTPVRDTVVMETNTENEIN